MNVPAVESGEFLFELPDDALAGHLRGPVGAIAVIVLTSDLFEPAAGALELSLDELSLALLRCQLGLLVGVLLAHRRSLPVTTASTPLLAARIVG
jgi:hypothetical protein